jgi:hypothetical protein
MKIRKEAVYVPSEDVVAREIEGELIIVPLAAGVGDMEGELYNLNDAGKAIWKCLDGLRNLDGVIETLIRDYEAAPGEIERDVVGLLEELIRRRMIVEVETV